VQDLTISTSHDERIVKELHLHDISLISDHRLISFRVEISQQKRELMKGKRKTNRLTYKQVLAE